MKKIMSVVSLALAFFTGAIMLSACGETQIAYGSVTRDPSNTGGSSLTFNYDDATHTASFGGAGETIAWYPADPDLNRTAGNRVGVQITAPQEVEDLSKAVMVIGSKEYKDGSFLESGKRYTWIYPVVSENTKEVKLYITWKEGTAKQEYTIKIVDGTTFATAS